MGKGVLRLTYENLIAKNRLNPAKPKILLPNEIPIHPYLREYGLPYTADFILGVAKAIPMSALQDKETIEDKLDKKLDLEVSPTALYGGDNSMVVLDPDYLKFIYRESVRELRVRYRDVAEFSIGCEDDNIFSYYNHPLPGEKARAYAISEDNDDLKLHGWGVRNIHSPGLAFEMFARNFAILFNNMGLDRLEK